MSERSWEYWVASREAEKVRRLKQKGAVHVVFIIIHHATWKADKLYELLFRDPEFHPSVIIAPDMARPVEWAEAYMRMSAEFFQSRGIKYYLASRDEHENTSLVKSINPEIVIFNNPHGLTCRSLHKDLLAQRLACYIPYHMEVGCYNDDQDQYNRPFHNAMWRIFAPHDCSLGTFKRVGRRRGENVVVTGYPGVEALIAQKESKPNDPWRLLGRKRIIWAPHHTIDMPSLPYASFLRYAEYFRKLVEVHAEHVQWCFKPHPLLKPKLIKHPDWGPERTEEYFGFWETHPVTQLELGAYVGLFRNSDAMIHDSGSFLAEYLYVNKPVMFLWSSSHVTRYFNEFGLDALHASERGNDESGIDRFLSDIMEGVDRAAARRSQFLSRHPAIVEGKPPSQRILDELKASLIA